MAEDEEPRKKKKSKLKWIILVFLLLMLGGLAAAWFFVFDQKLPFGLGGDESAPAQTQQQQQSVAIPPPDNLVTLPTFVVNLADPQGRRFIRLGLALEVASPAYALEIKQQEPRVRDAVIMLLTSKSYADLAAPDSKAELKRQITERINQTMGGPKVVQALITDLSIRYQ